MSIKFTGRFFLSVCAGWEFVDKRTLLSQYFVSGQVKKTATVTHKVAYSVPKCQIYCISSCLPFHDIVKFEIMENHSIDNWGE